MLTLGQHKVYRFITEYMQRHSCAPTMAEVADGIGIRSRGVAHRYVKALCDVGYLALEEGKKRNIRLLKRSLTKDFSYSLPLLGKIAAGQPIEAVVDEETVDITNMFLTQGRYVLRVQGDSMVDEGILDGDLIICHQTDRAEEGQIVVALIDRESATLKRLSLKNPGFITLHPANAAHAPQTYPSDRVRIQGVYVGLLRFS